MSKNGFFNFLSYTFLKCLKIMAVNESIRWSKFWSRKVVIFLLKPLRSTSPLHLDSFLVLERLVLGTLGQVPVGALVEVAGSGRS